MAGKITQPVLFFVVAGVLLAGIPAAGQTQSAAAKPLQPGRLLKDTIAVPPLTEREKLDFRIQSLVGPRALAGLAISAGISTGLDSPSEWGQGWSGYGLQYANAFGLAFVDQSLAFGLDSVLHEDPRFFPSRKHSFGARLENALKQVVICRKDDGRESFAYSRVISAFAAAQIANAWQPPSTRGVGSGLELGALILAADGAVNLAQEYIPLARPKSTRGGP